MIRQIIDGPIAIEIGRFFRKRAWRISLKQLVANFDAYMREVQSGRTLRIARHGIDLAVLVPIKKGLRYRTVLRKNRARICRKASKRW